MRSRYAPAGDNPRWRDIERAYNRTGRLTPNQQRFIIDIHGKGAGYNLSDKQHRYLSAIMHRLNKQAASGQS